MTRALRSSRCGVHVVSMADGLRWQLLLCAHGLQAVVGFLALWYTQCLMHKPQAHRLWFVLLRYTCHQRHGPLLRA